MVAWRVRREVAIGRDPTNPDAWVILLDGQPVHCHKAEVCTRKSVIDIPTDRSNYKKLSEWAVALVLDGVPYELEGAAGPETAQSLARVLAHALHGDASRIQVGRLHIWRPEHVSALDLAFVPFTVKYIGLLAPVAFPGAQSAIVGCLAVVVRIAIAFDRLASATAWQLDPKQFGKDFAGAEPVRPARWLDPAWPRIVRSRARAAMYLLAAAILVQHLFISLRRPGVRWHLGDRHGSIEQVEPLRAPLSAR